jgi:hypothetical protein
MGDPLRDGPDLLHGWKDIAAYLGRSVRSVQRWEATAGLPIRRITTPSGGQIVYASRTEIDEWRRTSAIIPDADASVQDSPEGADAVRPADVVAQSDAGDASLPAAGDEKSDGPAEVASTVVDDEGPARARPTFRLIGSVSRRAAGVLAVAAAVAIGVAGGVWLAVSILPKWSRPAEISIEGPAIVARNAAGREVWRHVLGGGNVRPFTLVGPRGAFTGDLGGDGELEFAIPASSAAPHFASAVTDTVYVFDRHGRLFQRIQPALRVRDGGVVFDAPWRLVSVAFSTTAPARLWAAYTHHTAHATFVIEAASGRAPIVRFLQSGRISSLAHWRTPQGEYLAVGGADREYQSASLTLLDLREPGGRWPDDGRGALSCDGCPATPPSAVFLLPSSDVTRADFRPFGWVHDIHPSHPDLTVDMHNGIGPLALDTTFTVRADLSIASFARAPRHWMQHRQFEESGRLTHTAEECPDAAMPIEVRQWRHGAGWQVQSVVAAASPSTAPAPAATPASLSAPGADRLNQPGSR